MADYISQFTGPQIDARLAKVSQLETGKQDKLVSGTNIKTINGQPVLGSGDMTIQAGDTDAVKYVPQTLTDAQKAQARTNIAAASAAELGQIVTDLTGIEADIDSLEAAVAAINVGDYVTATTLPTASASTMGHIYLIGPDANNNYDRYFTQESGGAYSWVPLGSTQINLSTYATQEEVSQLKAEVADVNDTISSFDVHQVQTSSAVEDPTGTRLRLVRKVYPGMILSGQCTAGKGMVADIYDTFEHALECPSANRLQRFTGGNYVTTEWSGVVEVAGYLSLSLCKTDSSAFSAQDKTDFLAASSASVVFYGLNGRVAELELDTSFPETVSADFSVTNHYIKYTNGVFTSSSNYRATPLYPVDGLEYFEYNIASGGTVAAVVGYFASTEAGGYISGIGGVNQTYTGKVYAFQLPSGTKYVSFSGKGSYSATLHYSEKMKPSVVNSGEKVGFLYKSYTDALYVLRKLTGSGYTVDDANGTRMRIIFKVPKGAHFKAASTEGVAVSLYTDITNAVLANTTYIETFAYSYVPEVGGVMSADGYLSISLTNGNTAITDAREAELLSSLSLVVGYGMEWDIYALSNATGEGVVALNNDMDDALVSVGGVNAYASGTYDSFTVQKKNMSILAISDIHGTFEAISRAVEFANAKPGFFDYVACLGDIVLRSPADSITDFEDSFADCGKPFLFTAGNHDIADTNLAGITEAQARTKYFSQIVTKGWISNFKDSTSCSWYKDNATHKIRIISVFEYGNSQEIATGAPGTYCRRWIPSDTLQWFADTLYSTPSDYSVVVLLHQIPFYPATYVDGKFTISQGIRPSIAQFFLNTVDGNPFGDIVDAFINGTSISQTYNSIASYSLGKTASVAKDFTGRGAGKFICFVVGHFHGSYVFKDATYPEQITIAVPSGSQSAFQQKYGDTNYAPGTRNEDQFYVIGFDTENELINIAKIGGQVTNDMVKRDIISVKY